MYNMAALMKGILIRVARHSPELGIGHVGFSPCPVLPSVTISMYTSNAKPSPSPSPFPYEIL